MGLGLCFSLSPNLAFFPFVAPCSSFRLDRGLNCDSREMKVLGWSLMLVGSLRLASPRLDWVRLLRHLDSAHGCFLEDPKYFALSLLDFAPTSVRSSLDDVLLRMRSFVPVSIFWSSISAISEKLRVNGHHCSRYVEKSKVLDFSWSWTWCSHKLKNSLWQVVLRRNQLLGPAAMGLDWICQLGRYCWKFEFTLIEW